jgi:guanine deaminase
MTMPNSQIIPQLNSTSCEKAIRASFLHFTDDPDNCSDSWQYFEDGLLILQEGKVVSLGEASLGLKQLPQGIEFIDYSGKLIMPGFIDTHNHYPQSDMIASYGAQLLEWLEKYTFPAERRFSDPTVANSIAEFYCEQLLCNGTTTSAAFATVHTESVDAIFSAAQKRDMCLISGKVMMDRNAPDFLCDDADSSYQQSAELIKRWHGQGRNLYAVTPRFAPTSSEAQLQAAGQLLKDFDGLYLQSHVAENQNEVAWVKRLFPQRRSYLDVYDYFGLLGERSVYGHCIYLDDIDHERLADSGVAIAFCPTSNLFLGSGLFNLEKAKKAGIRVGLGTDVGAGTSFSLLQTLNEAYKVSQLSWQSLSSIKAFYLVTLGAAKSLYVDDQLGNFEVGKAADFVVLDLNATALMQRRMTRAESIEDQLFVLMMLGDDRAVHATHVMGSCQYQAGL